MSEWPRNKSRKKVTFDTPLSLNSPVDVTVVTNRGDDSVDITVVSVGTSSLRVDVVVTWNLHNELLTTVIVNLNDVGSEG